MRAFGTVTKTALELLGRQDLIEQLDIECVGTPGSSGVSGSGSGKGSLDAALTFLRDNPRFLSRPVLLLYDHDTGKNPFEIVRLAVRTIPHVVANTIMDKGIENLFPDALFADTGVLQPFIRQKQKPVGYGLFNTIRELDKQRFCDWMCSERRNPHDFVGFSAVVGIFEEFLYQIRATK
ncbi:MAG TPA: hypothetical protein VKD72_00920 [Gemmataceae bacterium]|nr:hypothetical protein [Gemmataceae bacterium]